MNKSCSKEKPGQYEHHYAFTMSGLCRFATGINVFDPTLLHLVPISPSTSSLQRSRSG
jgi:hypothetical protein